MPLSNKYPSIKFNNSEMDLIVLSIFKHQIVFPVFLNSFAVVNGVHLYEHGVIVANYFSDDKTTCRLDELAKFYVTKWC